MLLLFQPTFINQTILSHMFGILFDKNYKLKPQNLNSQNKKKVHESLLSRLLQFDHGLSIVVFCGGNRSTESYFVVFCSGITDQLYKYKIIEKTR